MSKTVRRCHGLLVSRENVRLSRLLHPQPTPAPALPIMPNEHWRQLSCHNLLSNGGQSGQAAMTMVPRCLPHIKTSLPGSSMCSRHENEAEEEAFAAHPFFRSLVFMSSYRLVFLSIGAPILIIYTASFLLPHFCALFALPSFPLPLITIAVLLLLLLCSMALPAAATLKAPKRTTCKPAVTAPRFDDSASGNSGASGSASSSPAAVGPHL
jgi:hypothetical protein